MRRAWALYLLLTVVLFACTASGRITFPDDEIVFQTTEAIATRGSLDIPGIARRSGEPDGRPRGTFGWAPEAPPTEEDREPRRYGFFGHGLSIVALPMYFVGEITSTWIPPEWSRATRSDLMVFHARSPAADWRRLVVSFTNSLITPLTGLVLGLWLIALGYRLRTAILTALAYALCTSAWPYTSTFLSEPLSALCLVTAAWASTRWGKGGPSWWLWLAVTCAGFSIHVHLLNLVALPCLLLHAIMLGRSRGDWARQRGAWAGAACVGLVALIALGWSQAYRFGSPFESGRYDHYGHFMAPWEALAAQLVGPGRSFFAYSPAILVALLGWRKLRSRAPEAALLILAMVLLRWGFVSTRSDWWGGWAIGPRYMVPVIPFAMVPLASVLERRAGAGGRLRRIQGAALGGFLMMCAMFEAHLAAHSIFEWMFELMRHARKSYFTLSHWNMASTPTRGFAGFDANALSLIGEGSWTAAFSAWRLDMLSFGALKLAKAGYPGLLWIFCALALVGLGAAVGLWRALPRAP